MELEFWNERWKKGETGFHQESVNPYLGYYYGERGPGSGQRKNYRVFVPLCGKSLDMNWLSQNGYAVVGVECSEIAVRSFFEQNELPYEKIGYENYVKYVYKARSNDNDIEILQADFFALKKSDLGEITDIYDRASLIALPSELRSKYVRKLSELQAPGTRSLLITLSYEQAEMAGPPFSVSEDEVNELYGKEFDIKKLAQKDVLEQELKFKQRGLSHLTETAYKLTRKK